MPYHAFGIFVNLFGVRVIYDVMGVYLRKKTMGPPSSCVFSVGGGLLETFIDSLFFALQVVVCFLPIFKHLFFFSILFV